ncbi:unnamed protein product [Amoebophrya sp. A25]|nr:unnamed protein product [Amoebophrya sp. A25]|eukprot:GSA25T00025568001.1
MRKDFLLKLREGTHENAHRVFHPAESRRRSDEVRKILEKLGIVDKPDAMKMAPPELIQDKVVRKIVDQITQDLMPVLGYEDAGTRAKVLGYEDRTRLPRLGDVLHFRDLLDYGTSMSEVILFLYQSFGVFELEAESDDFRDMLDMEELLLAHVQVAFVGVMTGCLEKIQMMPDPDSRARSLKIAFYYVASLGLRVVEDLQHSKSVMLTGCICRNLVKRINKGHNEQTRDFRHELLPPSTEAVFRWFLLTWRTQTPIACEYSAVVQLLCRQIIQATAELNLGASRRVDASLATGDRQIGGPAASRAFTYSVDALDHTHILEYAEQYLNLLAEFFEWNMKKNSKHFDKKTAEEIVNALFQVSHQVLMIFMEAMVVVRREKIMGDLADILYTAAKASSVGGAVSWIKRDIAHLFSADFFPQTANKCVTPRARRHFYELGGMAPFINEGRDYVDHSTPWRVLAEEFEY